MEGLANVSVNRPVFTSAFVLAIVVLGIAGYTRLGVDRFPKVDMPIVSVVTRLPGATPEEIETNVSDRIEASVNTISGLDELRSRSTESVSQVFLRFDLEKDVDVATQEVREKIALVFSQLPRGVEPPVVTKLDPGATPVMYLAVRAARADMTVRRLTQLADRQIRPRVETVSGVGQVDVLGGRARRIEVVIDPLRLRALGLTALDVRRALAAENIDLPAGNIKTGAEERTVRVHDRVGAPAALGDLVVQQQDGRWVHVSDVARVEDGEEDGDTWAMSDGARALVLSIRKQSDANTVAVVDALRRRTDELQLALAPAGVRLEVLRDNSRTIRASTEAVKVHLLLGALLAAFVVLIFLGDLRSTVIAAVAIPVSIVATFALLWAKGFTLNGITLLALALAVGIVIDDAIVVIENIHRFVEHEGMPPARAAIHATREIGLAVLATTLSLLAVFVPVAFMSGLVGRFLQGFGLTMAFAVAVSLLVSFTLTPLLSSRWLRADHARAAGHSAGPPRSSPLKRIADRVYLPLERLYMRALAFVMAHRLVIGVVAAAAIAAIVPLGRVVKKGFLPESDEAHFEINVRTPEGTTLEQTALTAERIARQVRAMPDVRSTLSTIGDNPQRAANLANIYVALSDPAARRLAQDEIMAQVRREVLAKQDPALRTDVSLVPLFAGDAQAIIMYDLSGPDLSALQRYSDEMVARMRAIPGAADVSSSLTGGKPELSVSIDRERAADLGVSTVDVADALGLLVGGEKVSTYEEGDELVEVWTRAEREWRTDVQGLTALTVPSRRLGAVPLADLATLEPGRGPGEVDRLGRRRQVTLSANVAPGFAGGDVGEAVRRAFADLHMPADYVAAPVGRSKEMEKARRAFLLAFALSFVFMYLVLAAQFESWLHPAAILVALPLTLPFALLSLIVLRQSLNVLSALGLLVLFGMVKKNGILQIDHANQLRARGMDRTQAILLANKHRLRPILMTTLAFVAGMIPLLLSSGIGAGNNRATAGVIVGGQLLSLLLTLLATPVAYSLFDDARAWTIFRRRDNSS
jgi:hydrophobe/amphiphile efflux-1 (HAE1) family protein